MNALFRRIIEWVPTTFSGLALLVLSFMAIQFYVIDQSDFFIRAVVSVFILVQAFLFVVTIIVRLCVVRKLRALQFQVDFPEVSRDSTVTLVNRGGTFKVYPMVEVTVASREPNRYQIQTESKSNASTIRLVPTRRGQLDRLLLDFHVADIFGLNKTTIRHTVQCQLDVSPKRPLLETAQLKLPNDGDNSAHPAGALAGDYVEMRQYAPGDPQRFILWKAYARSRKLLVRTPERAQSNEPAVALVLFTSPTDQAAADVARYFLEHTDQPLAFGACGMGEIAYDTRTALALLKASGQLTEYTMNGLVDALKPVLDQSGGRLVVVASPEDQWLTTRLEILSKSLQLSPHVLLASTNTHRIRPARLQRLGIIRPNTRRHHFAQLTNVIHNLRQLSIGFEVINPQSGKRWEQHEWL